jgi:glycosyltransferase involved in cell wall biosynthesis
MDMNFTVITPVLNGGPLLADCIKSVRRERQSGQTVEHIVLDGGSTDGSVALARSLGAHVIERPDLCLNGRINLGFAEAPDGLVLFIGADDLLVEGCVPRVLAAYRATGRPWVSGAVRWIDKNGRHLAVLRPIFSCATSEQHAAIGHPLIPMSATWLEKSFFQEVGGFDPRYSIAAEYDFTTRALAEAPFARLTNVISEWRLTGENFSVINRKRQAQEYRAVSIAYGPKNLARRLFWGYGHRLMFNLVNPDYVRGKTISRVAYMLGLGTVQFELEVIATAADLLPHTNLLC